MALKVNPKNRKRRKRKKKKEKERKKKREGRKEERDTTFYSSDIIFSIGFHRWGFISVAETSSTRVRALWFYHEGRSYPRLPSSEPVCASPDDRNAVRGPKTVATAATGDGLCVC